MPEKMSAIKIARFGLKNPDQRKAVLRVLKASQKKEAQKLSLRDKDFEDKLFQAKEEGKKLLKSLTRKASFSSPYKTKAFKSPLNKVNVWKFYNYIEEKYGDPQLLEFVKTYFLQRDQIFEWSFLQMEALKQELLANMQVLNEEVRQRSRQGESALAITLWRVRENVRVRLEARDRLVSLKRKVEKEEKILWDLFRSKHPDFEEAANPLVDRTDPLSRFVFKVNLVTAGFLVSMFLKYLLSLLL